MAVDVIDRLRRETPAADAPAIDAGALFAQIVAEPRDRTSRERRRGPRLVVVALLAVLVVAAPLALARGTHLLDFVFGSSPPKNVQTFFLNSLPRDLGPKQGPHPEASQKDLIRSSEKLVAQITTSSGAVARMYAADLRTGGKCFVALGGPFNGGSCRFGPPKARFPIIAGSGSWGNTPKGSFGDRVTYFGHADPPRAVSLIMHFKDGAGETIPLSHGWFMYEIPDKHERWGHEPTRVDVLDGTGRYHRNRRRSVRPPSEEVPADRTAGHGNEASARTRAAGFEGRVPGAAERQGEPRHPVHARSTPAT